MAGAGAVAIGSLVRAPRSRRALRGYVLACWRSPARSPSQLVLIDREGDPLWWRIPLVLLCAGALVAIPLARAPRRLGARRRGRALLVAPMVYSFSVWLAPVSGTFPTAGPYSYAGTAATASDPTSLRADRALIRFLRQPTARRRPTPC
jgi:hypothetical protein